MKLIWKHQERKVPFGQPVSTIQLSLQVVTPPARSAGCKHPANKFEEDDEYQHVDKKLFGEDDQAMQQTDRVAPMNLMFEAKELASTFQALVQKIKSQEKINVSQQETIAYHEDLEMEFWQGIFDDGFEQLWSKESLTLTKLEELQQIAKKNQDKALAQLSKEIELRKPIQ